MNERCLDLEEKERLPKKKYSNLFESGIREANYQDLIKLALTRDKFSCQECGKSMLSKGLAYGLKVGIWKAYQIKVDLHGGFEVHHIVPLSQGGRNFISNVITLCNECHILAHKKLREVPQETKVYNQK